MSNSSLENTKANVFGISADVNFIANNTQMSPLKESTSPVIIGSVIFFVYCMLETANGFV